MIVDDYLKMLDHSYEMDNQTKIIFDKKLGE